jgi:hypothetical protein
VLDQVQCPLDLSLVRVHDQVGYETSVGALDHVLCDRAGAIGQEGKEQTAKGGFHVSLFA